MAKAVDDDQEGKERVGMPLPVRFWFSVWPFAYGIQYEKVMLWYMMPWMSNINQTEPIRRKPFPHITAVPRLLQCG